MATRSLCMLTAAGVGLIAFTYLVGTLVGGRQAELAGGRVVQMDAGGDDEFVDPAHRPGDARDGDSEGRPPVERTPKRPPVVVDPPALELGTVGFNRTVTATAHLRNTSDETIRIATHRPSCTCTAAEVPEYEIPPHGSVPVTITYDSTNRLGRDSAAVHVVFEKYDEVVQVMMSVEVAEGVRIEPPIINALRQQRGSIVIESLDSEPFEVLTFGGGPPVFIDFDSSFDEPRARYEIAWDFSEVEIETCEDAHGRWMAGWMPLETTHPEVLLRDVQVLHPCTLTVRRVGRDRWMALDRRVLMAEVEPYESRDHAVRIAWPRELPQEDVPVRAVHAESEQFSAELIDSRFIEGRTHITLRLTPAPEVRGLFQGDVRLEAEDGLSDWVHVIGTVRER